MKRILLITVLALIFCFHAVGQEREPIQDNFVDRYGKITWKYEEERLQSSVFIELKEYPDHKAVFIFSYKNNSELKLIKSRQKKILKMFENNKIPAKRCRFAVGKENHYSTVIWLVPEGADAPN